MLDVRCILCPVDFSDAARHALAHAVTVARWYRSRIVALHVGSPAMFVNPPIIFAALPEAVTAVPAGRHQIEAQLREWLAPAAAAGLETDVIVTEGPVAAHILDRARSLPADLIVIGSHGRAGVERLILGSVTEKVVREAPCPVMTVPPAAAATSHLPFKHLLCPVDFSRSSLAAMRFAFSLAQESDARLTLLNVFEGAREPSVREADTPEFRSRWESETKRELSALVPDQVRDWCTPDVTVAFGRAADRILDLALDDHADLIVMGVQGRTAVDLVLFGSTTNSVVRQAPCPVLTLRSV